jgi:hypothetical protein
MKTENDPSFDGDDVELAKLISMLKQVEPTSEEKGHYRHVVARELANGQGNVLRPAQPWWKRSMSASFPFVTGVTVGVLATLMLSFPRVDKEASNSVAPVEVIRDVKDGDSPRSKTLRESFEDAPVVDRYFSNVYLCGIGEVSTTSQYTIRETSQ